MLAWQEGAPTLLTQSEMTALVPADRLRGVVVFIPFVTVS